LTCPSNYVFNTIKTTIIQTGNIKKPPV